MIEEILSLVHKHDRRGKTTNLTIGDAPRLNLDIGVISERHLEDVIAQHTLLRLG